MSSSTTTSMSEVPTENVYCSPDSRRDGGACIIFSSGIIIGDYVYIGGNSYGYIVSGYIFV